MLRLARSRSLISFLLGVLVLTSFWHVSHADFHTHSESGVGDAHVHSLPTSDTGEDSASFHPVHVLAYLSAAPALMFSPRAVAALSTESTSVHSRPPSGLFRPPRS